MSDADGDGVFDDFDTDPDDSAAVDAFIAEVAEAVEAFGLTVLEPGEMEADR